MQSEIKTIEIFDEIQNFTTSIHVKQVSDNVYEIMENCLFINELSFGTQFETLINKQGKHQIINIVKESAYITKRFLLTTQFKETDYRLLGDEIIKSGGFWQVDFGNIATLNLPQNCPLNLDEIFKSFDFSPVYID